MLRPRLYDALCSAALHLAGLTDAKPPSYVIHAAQCVIATSVGVKFAGTSPEKVASTFVHALGSTGLLLVVASVFSFVSCRITGAPWPLVMLAYSPGVGLYELTARLTLFFFFGFERSAPVSTR